MRPTANSIRQREYPFEWLERPIHDGPHVTDTDDRDQYASEVANRRR